jgi:hypothetical protein
MKELLILAVPLLTLATLYCGWRTLHLFLVWAPAVAMVVRSDYGRLQQQDDFWSRGPDMTTVRDWNWRDGEDARLIEDVVEYEDGDGNRHRRAVERRVMRGRRPDGVYTIWYDPADPAKITAWGPGCWAAATLLLGFTLAGLFRTGLMLAGTL